MLKNLTQNKLIIYNIGNNLKLTTLSHVKQLCHAKVPPQYSKHNIKVSGVNYVNILSESQRKTR